MEMAVRLAPEDTAPVFPPELLAELPKTNSPELSPLELALERQARKYEVGADNDGHTLAYAFRGGGVKVISNAGKAEELHQYRPDPAGPNLLQVADIMVGDSAGALIAAAAAAEQSVLTPRVIEIIALQRLIDYKNLVRREPVIGLGRLREYVESSLDVDAIFDSPTELLFPVANLRTMETEIYSTKDGSVSKDDLIDRIFEGMHMPILAGKTTDAAADGGLLIESTETLAADAGATDIIGFSNTPESASHDTSRWIMRAVGVWIQANGKAPRLGGLRQYRKHVIEQSRFLPTLSSGEYEAQAGVRLDMVYPDDVEDAPGMIERDPQKIMNGYIAGRNSVRGKLGLPLIEYTPVPARSPIITFAKQAKEAYGNAVSPSIATT